MIYIVIPSNIKLIVLKNNYIYIYNKNYFFLIKILEDYFFNKYLNSLKIKTNNKIKNLKLISNFLFLWEGFLFNKFSFVGKGFKIKKKKKKLTFFFNHAHLNLLFIKNTIVKKIRKNKILIFNKNFKTLKILKKIILNVKQISFYTKRGLRVNKQILYIKKR